MPGSMLVVLALCTGLDAGFYIEVPKVLAKIMDEIILDTALNRLSEKGRQITLSGLHNILTKFNSIFLTTYLSSEGRRYYAYDVFKVHWWVVVSPSIPVWISASILRILVLCANLGSEFYIE
ncbi:5884_t:CDS:2, partial [Gigaspora rosea]